MYNKKKAADKPVGKSSGLNHSSSTRTFSKKSDSKKTISQQGKTHKPAAVKIESDAEASYRKISTAVSQNQDVCPVHRKCGGCQYQGMAYKKQLSLKQRQANMLLGKFGPVLPIIGMKDPLHYRNKVHAVFAFEKGKAIAGTYQEGTHKVVPVESCLIDDEKSDAIIQTIRGLLRSFKIKTYNEDSGYGLLRHVLIRRGFTSGEIMVVLVASSPVILNVNDQNTSMVLGDRNITLYGKGFIVDTLCGHTFAISPSAFYQVNPVQTEILYQTAMDYAGLTGKETVVDAYCGIGTIGIIAADKAKSVIGVELNPASVKDARNNARHNNIGNITFYQNDAERFLNEMQEQNAKADVIFMDPPRAGSTQSFMASAIFLNPNRIVYISCNPETLARDLEFFKKHQYTAEKIQPVDMFPFTTHMETVCLLTRRKHLAKAPY